MTRRTRFLVNEHPAIAEQWHPTLNEGIELSRLGPGSHKRVFWQCEAGHVWQAQVHNRVAGSGCPECAGYVPRGQKSLAERAPHLLAEWHPRNDVSPDEVGPGSRRRVWWRCGVGHEYQARISSRRSGTGCPACTRAGRRAEPAPLSSMPGLLAQVDPDVIGDVDPGRLPVTSAVRLGWICPKGHRWETKVRHRAIAGTGCPQCAGRRRSPALRTSRPELAAEWHARRNGGLDLARITTGSQRTVWWQCTSCSGEFRAAVFHRVRGVTQCPGCSRRVRYQDLASESPETAALWHPRLNGDLTPRQVKAGANVKVWWRCPAGHEAWSAAVAQVFLGHQACPGCRTRRGISRQETELFAELQHVLTGGMQQRALRTPGRLYRLDMAFPAGEGREAVVEFDGSYWHRGAEARDRAKADDIEASRPHWTVVRVREEPLEVLRPADVTVPLLADPFTAASLVLDHLMTLLPWPAATHERARAYTAEGRRRGQELAERLTAARRPAPHADEAVPPAPSSQWTPATAVQQPLW
ncbi:zinc-ribbon domain-containing protein [Streptomyces olivoreticuli]